jgi:hypothetical protein
MIIPTPHKVSLIRQNGEKKDDIPAFVKGDEILIKDMSMQMEEGDKIIWMRPNEIEAKYIIQEIRYVHGISGVPGGVRLFVRKETKIDDLEPSHIGYHQHGNAQQVNIGSPDASLNITSITQIDIFEKLEKVINEQIADADASSKLMSEVEDIKKSRGKIEFLEHYTKFIASAANHATLITAVLQMVPAFYSIMSKLK